MAADAQGNFVVVWDSNGSYGTDQDCSIQGQRYDADGCPYGSEFQVNSYTTGYQWRPAVAADERGNFVVVWDSYGSYGTDTDYSSVQANATTPAALPWGAVPGQLLHDGVQWLAGVNADARQLRGGLGKRRLVRHRHEWPKRSGQRYSLPIFTDGFESGDTSAWSSSVP